MPRPSNRRPPTPPQEHEAPPPPSRGQRDPELPEHVLDWLADYVDDAPEPPHRHHRPAPAPLDRRRGLFLPEDLEPLLGEQMARVVWRILQQAPPEWSAMGLMVARLAARVDELEQALIERE
jgi:hypothetical protein